MSEEGMPGIGMDRPELTMLPEHLSQEEQMMRIATTDMQLNKKVKVVSNKRDLVLESLEGRTIRITALTIDIVNSTMNVKPLSSEQAGEYYQTFIEMTAGLIEAHGGYVLKNVGDCVIGFFPSGEHLVENHDSGVLCGFAMFDTIRNLLNPYLTKNGLPAIKCRISADFGPAKVLRVRLGSRYSTIDLFGSALNTAAKISRYAKPDQMVVGDELFWQLVKSTDFEFRLVNRWDLSGKHDYPVYIVKRNR